MLKFGLLLVIFALCQGHAVLPAVHAVHAAPVAYPLQHGLFGHGIAGSGFGGHGLVGFGLGGHGHADHGLVGTGLGDHGIIGTGLVSHGVVGTGLAGHGLIGHGGVAGIGNGHHLYKRSPHVVAPYEHVAPIAHVAPVAVSHQYRVDVRKSPAVVAVVPIAKPVLTTFVPAPSAYTFAGNFGAGHYGGQGYGSVHSALGHY